MTPDPDIATLGDPNDVFGSTTTSAGAQTGDPDIAALGDPNDVFGDKPPVVVPSAVPKKRYQSSGPIPTSASQDVPQENLTWEQAAAEGLKNFVPSAEKAASGIYEAVRHPLDTLSTLKQLGVGIDSKIAGEAGQQQDPAKKAQDEALVNSLMQSYANKYGSIDDIKNYMAHDPASLAFDIATIGPGAELAGLRAGSLIGKAGDVAANLGADTIGSGLNAVGDTVGGVGRAAGAVGRAANPLNPGGILTGALNKVAPATFAATDSVGSILPDISDRAEALTGVGADTLQAAGPDATQAFTSTIADKGPSDAAIQEGIAKAAGINPTQQAVTGVASSDAARPAVIEATARNNGLLANAATDLAGGARGPSTSDLGGALENAQVESMNSAKAGYNLMNKTDAQLTQQIPIGTVNTALNAALKDNGHPSLAALSTVPANMEAYPQANLAAARVQDLLSKGVTANTVKGPIDAAEFMHNRKLLNGLLQNANRSDISATNAIIQGYHNILGDAGKTGIIQDAQGTAIPGLSDAMQATNDAYANHFKTFVKGNPAIANAVKYFKRFQEVGQDGSVVASGSPEVHEAAQGALSKALLDPTAGKATYASLVDAMGGPGTQGANTVDTFIQNAALANDGTALTPLPNMASIPGKATKMAQPLINDDSSVVAKAFSNNPQGLAKARLLHAAHRINNTKPSTYSSARSLMQGMGAKAALKGAAAGVGFVAGHGLPGALVGEMIEPGIEHMLNGPSIGRQLKGAPRLGNKVGKIGNVGRAIVSPKLTIPAHLLAQGNYLNAPVTTPTTVPISTNKKLPRNVRNHNPDNITDGKFAQSQPGYQGSDGEMAIFDNPANGYAAAKTLLRKYAATGRNTINKIVDSWAPASDKRNSPEARAEYKKYLSHRLGIGLDDPIDVSGDDSAQATAQAIAHFEGDRTAASGGRITRASGGKTERTHEQRVQRLMHLAKRAKKAEDAATKPLLNVPDNTVVKALDVAQQAI